VGALAQKISEEEGVSAVIFAICIAALLAAAALAIDAGSIWNARRKLVTDIDAAALAAARALSLGGEKTCEEDDAAPSVRAEATQVFQANQDDSSATPVTFEIVPAAGDCDWGTGSVTVAGRLKAPVTFAGIFGVNEVDVYAASSAQYGHVIAMSGMAPLALCLQDKHVEEWGKKGQDPNDLEHPTVSPDGRFYSGAYGSGRRVHRIGWQEGICSGGTTKEQAGSWAWLDFDGGRDRRRDLEDRLRNGYPGVVRFDDLLTPASEADCNPATAGNQPCPASRHRPKKSALNEVKCPEASRWEECQLLWIVIHEKVTKAGEYEHIAVWGVALRGWSLGGGDDDDDDDDGDGGGGFQNVGEFLDLEFTQAAAEGSIGANPAKKDFFSAPAVSQICGVEYAGEENLNCEG
jgi:hypothetical protein